MRWAAWNVHAHSKLPRSPTGPEIISEKLHELGKNEARELRLHYGSAVVRLFFILLNFAESTERNALVARNCLAEHLAKRRSWIHKEMHSQR